MVLASAVTAAVAALWFAVSRCNMVRNAAAGDAASGGIFSDGSSGIGTAMLSNGITNTPFVAVVASASLAKFNDLTLVAEPRSTESAACGKPVRNGGPQ